MLNNKNKGLYSFLFASSLGTFLEFFDLALYSFASALIAKHFFPANDPAVSVLATWGIFAVSYLMRPLGALWFGYIADVKSSRRAMVISMSMMAVATTSMGLLPGYAVIGIWAPIILLILRIMQSIAVSPEYNLPSVFIKNNQWCSQHFGQLV
jgi:MHS family proline/betaine transporter-like MFS transporter